MSKATQTQWRVQCRKSRNHKWVNKGLFETRNRARDQAAYLREGIMRCGETLTVMKLERIQERKGETMQ